MYGSIPWVPSKYHQEAPTVREEFTKNRSRLSILWVFPYVAVGCLLTWVSFSNIVASSLGGDGRANAPLPTVQFAVTNEYSSEPEIYTQQSAKGGVENLRIKDETQASYEWYQKLMAEPFRTTTLAVSVTGNDNLAAYTECTWSWSVEDESVMTVMELPTGSYAHHIFQRTGAHIAEVSLLCAEQANEQHTTVLLRETAEIMVKYVRRNLRTMARKDREGFLDALQTLYTVPSAEGKQVYGPEYRDIAFFVRKHLYGAADLACDHWHDGAGIMTHHVAFTLEFEIALQYVDPVVSIPYWDYTWDAFAYDGHRWGTWENSTVFHPDWFGPSSGSTDASVITEGRWAFTSVMRDTGSYSNITNPFRLLRSPWNTSPVPFIQRFKNVLGASPYNTFPTCNAWHAAFTTLTLAEDLNLLNGADHGPVHIMIGGQVGGKMQHVMDKYFANYTIEDALLLSKWMWRQGYVHCPDSCDEHDVSDTCECECPAALIGNASAYDFLVRAEVMHWLATALMKKGDKFIYFDNTTDVYRPFNMTMTQEGIFWNDFVVGLCSVGHAGEMFTSAAPYDPTFWPIHTTADRFLSWKRILRANGLIDWDESWAYVHDMAPGMTPASDAGQVCDWTAVRDGLFDLPNCSKQICPGHLPFEEIPWEKFPGDKKFDSVTKGARKKYTNAHFYAYSAPSNDDLPYVYDNFIWDHCEEQGYLFYPTNLTSIGDTARFPYKITLNESRVNFHLPKTSDSKLARESMAKYSHGGVLS